MKLSIIVLVVVTVVACRDASRSPGGPNFAVAADTTPGGCDAGTCHFNASGQAGLVYAGNPGTASLTHANSTAVVSQYDVACIELSH